MEHITLWFKIDNESSKSKLDIKEGEVKILEEIEMVYPIFVFDNKMLKMNYLNCAGEDTRV